MSEGVNRRPHAYGKEQNKETTQYTNLKPKQCLFQVLQNLLTVNQSQIKYRKKAIAREYNAAQVLVSSSCKV